MFSRHQCLTIKLNITDMLNAVFKARKQVWPIQHNYFFVVFCLPNVVAV